MLHFPLSFNTNDLHAVLKHPLQDNGMKFAFFVRKGYFPLAAVCSFIFTATVSSKYMAMIALPFLCNSVLTVQTEGS